jgi:hypothetical protein
MTSVGLVYLGACSFTAIARAGNDDESFVGNQAAMSGGAVSATVSDASATWYNPAGLASIAQTHIDVSGTAYALRFYSTPDLIRSRSGESTHLSLIEFVSIPAQLAYARRLGGGVTLGLGYFVPQSSNLLLRKSLKVEDGDAESAWQLAVSVTRVTHSFAAAIGLPLRRGARLGFGLVGTYEAESFATSIIASARQAGEQSAFLVSSSLGSSSRFGLEPSVGFQLELSPKVTLSLTGRGVRALMYQTSQRSDADATAGSGDAIGAELAEPREKNSGLHLLRAGRFGVGLAYRPSPRAWLAFELDAQPPIHSEGSGVHRRGVLNARLGGNYRCSDLVSLGAGLFTDRSSEPPSADAINGTGDFYGGTVGIELGNRHRLHPEEHSDALLLSTTLALKYAYSKGSFNGVLVDPANVAALSGAARPLIAHETSLYVGGGVSF